MYADVVFPLKLPPLTYRVPTSAPQDLIGRIVRAPLLGKSHYGLVTEVLGELPPALQSEKRKGRVKELESVHEGCASPPVLRLLKWLAEYHLAPIGTALKTMFFDETIHALQGQIATAGRKARGAFDQLDEGRAASEVRASEDTAFSAEITRTIADHVSRKAYGSFLFHALSVRDEYLLIAEIVGKLPEETRGLIILVPEISQIERLSSLLRPIVGNRLAVLHSKLTKAKRVDVIRRIHSRVSDVVIGTRSAVFAPLPELSFIAVAGEHSPSYKAEEGLRYHGRDVAVMRGFVQKSTVLLSSICPSLESVHNVMVGKYAATDEAAYLPGTGDTNGDESAVVGTPDPSHPHFLPLRQPPVSLRLAEEGENPSPSPFSKGIPGEPGPSVKRGRGGPGEALARHAVAPVRPKIRLLDLRRRGREGPLITGEAMKLVKSLLLAGEPVLFLVPRKGYSLIRCDECGHVVSCSKCRVPKVFFKTPATMRCRYCGGEESLPTVCERCKGFRLGPFGAGTERVKEELEKALHTDALLIEKGTQKPGYRMVLDDPELSPVVVGTAYATRKAEESSFGAAIFLNVDTSLSRPNFRAYERAFQEVMEVSQLVKPGGTLALQTWTPERWALRCLRRYNFAGFYAHELSQRRTLEYPPFSRIILFTLCLKGALCPEALEAFTVAHGTGVEVLGPVERESSSALCGRSYQVLMKSKDKQLLQKTARETLQRLETEGKAKVTVDVDPLEV